MRCLYICFSLALVAACGDVSTPTDPDAAIGIGAIGEACYANNTCDPGLRCTDDICVSIQAPAIDAGIDPDASPEPVDAGDLDAEPTRPDAAPSPPDAAPPPLDAAPPPPDAAPSPDGSF
jgi:hypothetical protein